MYDFDYKIVKLIQRYFADDLTPGEEQELREWLAGSHRHQEIFDAIRQGENLEDRERVWKQTNKQQALNHFEKKIGYQRRGIVRRLVKYAAVVMIPLLAVLSWQWLNDEEKVLHEAPVAIQPGRMQATLTLEDGAGIPLNRVGDEGFSISQSGARIRNTMNGIVYTDTINTSGITSFNRLKTPRGGEYNVTLSDGTKVYLNAASDLKYPVVFDKDCREVYLSGEAYFEVAKDSKRPFYVVIDAVKIEVYGTSFNVNTHYNNQVQTVLISGKIGVKGNESGLYKVAPSELVEFTSDGKFIRQEKVNVLPYIAWRDGQFIFENESLEQIMSTLSLWYDVDVFYASEKLKAHKFTGHMKKYENINTILDAISKIMEVNFIIKDKTITVMK